METKRICVNGSPTDYSISEDGDVYSHKYMQNNKLKISITISRTVELCIQGKKRKKFAISKLMNEYFPENKKFTPTQYINSLEYDKWYDIPDYDFYRVWNIIEANYFKNTSFVLETDVGDQQFRKKKRKKEIEL